MSRNPPLFIVPFFVLLPWLAATTPAADAPPRRMSYLDNGTLRVGVDLELGGAITHLSASGENPENLVNSFDWGRQIQMSHYAGPVPFVPHGKQPRKDWAALGWNPVQSGDCFGHRSKVLEHRNDGKELYVKCVPMQWPLDDEPGECTFECWITLADHAARVRCRLVDRRQAATQYPARHQEMPAIYTNGPWWKLMTYAGDKPFTGGAPTQAPAKMPWTYWQATENWAALVDDRGRGVGVWEPGVYAFCGGFAGKPGEGGPRDNPTGYVAPLHREIIDANIEYEYGYTLILGTLEEIRKYVYDHAARPAPPAYRFAADRQHWHYANATDAGWPVKGELDVRPGAGRPMLVGPDGFWPADAAPTLYVEAACRLGRPQGRVYWKRSDDATFSAAKSVPFELRGDGQSHVYAIDLRASPEYRGNVTGLRLDPAAEGSAGDFFRVKSIGFERPPK